MNQPAAGGRGLKEEIEGSNKTVEGLTDQIKPVSSENAEARTNIARIKMLLEEFKKKLRSAS